MLIYLYMLEYEAASFMLVYLYMLEYDHGSPVHNFTPKQKPYL